LAAEAARLGKAPDAIRLYSASTNLDASNARVLLSLGDLCKAGGHIDDARRYWSQAVRLGGTTVAEGRQRLASLAVATDSVRVDRQSTPTVPPPDQPARQPPPNDLHPAANELHKVWVVTVVSGANEFVNGGGGGGAVNSTVTDPSKETAEAKAMQFCKKWAPFGYQNSCRIASERQQDAAQ
jgi:hypothetical protein